MPRALFEKTGNAIWISHLDLMRVFQRSFKRAGLPLTHTQGFNPRPSVSIALPMSVGVESQCELLDFDLEGDRIPNEEICERLNRALVEGVRVLRVYDDGAKLKHLCYLSCEVELEYDNGIPAQAHEEISRLFAREAVTVEKKNKNGTRQENIIPMIKRLEIAPKDGNTLVLRGLVCCQNPTLNPMQLCTAIDLYLPELKPDFARCRRMEIYDETETVFR